MLCTGSQLDTFAILDSFVTVSVFCSVGFPEHMPFGEFRRRFDILAASQFRNTGPVLDEKKVSELFFFFFFCDRIHIISYFDVQFSVPKER